MAIKIKSTKDYKSYGVKGLVYGPAGIGKTRLCATAPDPIIISAEAGLLSLSDVDVPVIDVKTVEDVNEVYEWITLSSEADQYKTICLDSITEIAEVLLSTFKAEDRDARQAYGRLADEMTKTIRSFRDLKSKNVYFSAKQIRIISDTGVTVYLPSMPGKQLLNALPFFFDEVFAYRIGNLEDGAEYRYLQTYADIKYEGKDRSGKLNAIEKPDLTYIYNKISGTPPEEN